MGTATLDNAEVELLWAMTKAVELLRNYFYRKGVCVIDNAVNDFVKISWHIFLKDFVSYAASFRES